MAGYGDLPGRSGILALFKDCLSRTGQPRDLPVTVLLGPRGSGKSWTLTYLRDACASSVAIPHVYVDCAEPRRARTWELVCAVADGLHVRWPEFGRLDFPRVTLGRLAVQLDRLPDDDEKALRQLRDALAERARLAERGVAAEEYAFDVGQALDISSGLTGLLGRAIRSAVTSRKSVDTSYRTGLAWYGERGPDNRSGMLALVALNRRHHDERHQHVAEVFVEALLADLHSAFGGKRRRYNCAVLLDNCDTAAGTGLLNRIADARAARAAADPLVVVAGSGTVPELTGLGDRWAMPWIERHAAPESIPYRMPEPESADYEHWQTRRGNPHTSASWWLPVYLRDLTLAELDHSGEDEHRQFVHRLTGGHPYCTQLLLDSIDGRELGVEAVRRAVDQFPAAADYLLGDLSAHRENLPLLAASLHVDAAARAAVGWRSPEATSDLTNEVEKRLWLVEGKPRRGPQLHPWLRRLLLWELARRGQATWNQAHGELRDRARDARWTNDAAYHALATGNVALAVDYLAEQFHLWSAEEWIQNFNAITSAPRPTTAPSPSVDQYETLLLTSDAPPGDDVARTLRSMVIARWIWAEPIGDPTFALADTIAAGFAKLADEASTGQTTYRREARAYREMRSR